MSKDYVRQHIVPQSYLRRFTNKCDKSKKSRIGVRYDINGKIKLVNKLISDVACIKNYYDVTKREDPKYWEKYFSREIESLYGRKLGNIISKLILSAEDEEILNSDEISILSKLICFQFLRVPMFLDRHINNAIDKGKLLKEIIECTYGNKLPKEQIDVLKNMKLDDDFFKNISFEFISNEERLEFYSNILIKKKWLYLINYTNVPFVTSDNPVILYNYIKNDYGYENNGIARNDSIIFFPISSNILVEILPALFDDLDDDINNKRVFLNECDMKFICDINKLQINHSNREVYMNLDYYNKIIRND